MILLITGQPGAGKTLRVMWYLNEDETYKDRPVYTNINGSPYQPIPDGDWRNVPDGSVVVIDEVQFFYPQRRAGLPVPDQVSAMDTHRHRGIDLILTTQRPTGVDHHVRGLLGRHEHMRSLLNNSATIWWRNEVWECMDTRERDNPATESMLWKYPRQYFGMYKSSEVHTKRISIPKKVKYAIAILVASLILGIIAFRLIYSFVNADITTTGGVPTADDRVESFDVNEYQLPLARPHNGITIDNCDQVYTGVIHGLERSSVYLYDECTNRVSVEVMYCFAIDNSRYECFDGEQTININLLRGISKPYMPPNNSQIIEVN